MGQYSARYMQSSQTMMMTMISVYLTHKWALTHGNAPPDPITFSHEQRQPHITKDVSRHTSYAPRQSRIGSLILQQLRRKSLWQLARVGDHLGKELGRKQVPRTCRSCLRPGQPLARPRSAHQVGGPRRDGPKLTDSAHTHASPLFRVQKPTKPLHGKLPKSRCWRSKATANAKAVAKKDVKAHAKSVSGESVWQERRRKGGSAQCRSTAFVFTFTPTGQADPSGFRPYVPRPYTQAPCFAHGALAL